MEENIAFPVRAFEALPPNLTPSSYIDFLLLLGGLKPTIRLHVTEPRAQHTIKSWGEEHGYATVPDPSGYIYIATIQNDALRLQKLDDSHEAHEYGLGLLFGYPQCCCRRAAEVGESKLDEWEETLSQDVSFRRMPNCLIDPRGYTEGSSLISHIPCSAQCKASLSIARAALRIVLYQKNSHHFCRWSRWFVLPPAS
jgi:hypothetical protein